MATLYKNNIPYSDDNGAVKKWAELEALGQIISASITKNRPGDWRLTCNGSEVRSFAGAPSAMTALYELYIEGGGGDFSVFPVTVTPAVDMSNIDVTDGTLTISGHTWEDYSASPAVVGLRSDNVETFRTSVTGTESVSVAAGTARLLIGTSGAVPIFETLTQVPAYTFVADRRPMHIQGYATTTQANDEISWGQPREDYRATPITSNTAGFSDPNQNGRLKWVQSEPTNAANFGIERFQFINPAGWTSINAFNYSGTEYAGFDGNYQPHYPSNMYTGMSLTNVPLYAAQDSTAGATTLNTPFTVSGYANGDTTRTGQGDNTTHGDIAKAWEAAINDIKSTVGVNAEVCAYGGYRPCWDNANLDNLIKTQLGYSKPSTGNDGWSGTGDSPGWTPEPGYDGPGGTANSSATFRSWFDEEVAGIRDVCGFDSIGLDTGARAWDHAAGMANDAQGNAAVDYEDGRPGNDRIIELFNDYGMKPYLESVALDRWTHTNGSYDSKKLVPMTGADAVFYEKCATWAFLGSWWGYIDETGEDTYRRIGSGPTATGPEGWSVSGGYVWNESGTDGGATVGDPDLSGAGVFGANTEVHCVIRWDSTEVRSLLAMTNGWDIFRRLMYDFDQAGIIISTSANTTNSIASTSEDAAVTVTPTMFWDYVIGLYNGTSTRPSSAPPPATETVLAVAERTEDQGTDMFITGGQGWLQNNNSMVFSGTNVGSGSSTYPRLRCTGADPNTNAVVDFPCGTDAVRDAILAEDQDKLFARVTITEGGTTWTVDSRFYSDGGTTSTTLSQIRFLVDGADWSPSRPQVVDPQLNPVTEWYGEALGWDVTSGMKMEIILAP